MREGHQSDSQKKMLISKSSEDSLYNNMKRLLKSGKSVFASAFPFFAMSFIIPFFCYLELGKAVRKRTEQEWLKMLLRLFRQYNKWKLLIDLQRTYYKNSFCRDSSLISILGTL